MHEIAEFLKGFDFHTLIIVGVAMWWFTRDIKKEIRDIHKDMKEMREDMHKEFKFFNIRLSRVEGSFYGKDIYKEEKNVQ